MLSQAGPPAQEASISPDTVVSTPPVDEPTDAELIRRCIEGDRRASAELIDRYKRLVYSIPRRYRLPDDVCDDVFQTVFVSMTKSLPSLRDTQTLAKWLMTTTHRECWRLSRRRTATLDAAETPELASQHAPEDSMLKWERQHRVHAALEKLGGRCEKLLRLVFLDKTAPSYEEIGNRLGMPVGSIGPIRARCLAKLTEELEDLR